MRGTGQVGFTVPQMAATLTRRAVERRSAGGAAPICLLAPSLARSFVCLNIISLCEFSTADFFTPVPVCRQSLLTMLLSERKVCPW